MRSKITKNEAKAQIILFCFSLILLIIACFVGKLHYIWILISLSVVIALMRGTSPFGQTYTLPRFEKYGRIGTVSRILNATASVENILAFYVLSKIAELMSWRMVTLSWLLVILFVYFFAMQ